MLVAHRFPPYSHCYSVKHGAPSSTTLPSRPGSHPETHHGTNLNLVVDDAKQLVCVGDKDKSSVHVFSFSGDYYCPLEDAALFLSGPTALAIKPGSLATLSPISPPPTATAGVPIVTTMTLHDRTNSARERRDWDPSRRTGEGRLRSRVVE